MTKSKANSVKNIFAKKNFKSTLLAIMSLSLVISGTNSINQSPQANAASSSGLIYYDIKGSGTQYAPGNSGVMNFDYPMNFQYEAAVSQAGNASFTEGTLTHSFHGWIWNSNLGWISTACAGGTNTGINCGATNYQSTFESVKNGELHGYWWGDNTGWIALSCETLGTCGFVPFGAKVELSGPNAGKILPGNGFVWSNSVGWIDLAGVEFPWIAKKEEIEIVAALEEPMNWPRMNVTQALENLLAGTQNWATISAGLSGVPTDEVYALIHPDPSNMLLADPQNKLDQIRADGQTPYTVFLHLVDKNGQALNPSEVKITLNKEDKSAIDQLDPSSTNKTSSITWGDFTQIPNSPWWKAEITSIAPTSNMNGANLNQDCFFTSTKTITHTAKACDDTYKDTFSAKLVSNPATLQFPIDLTITDNSDPNQALSFNYGVPVYGGKELKFAPALTIPEISTKYISNSLGDQSLNAFRNELISVYYTVRNKIGQSFTNPKITFEASSQADPNNSSAKNPIDMVILSATDKSAAEKETITALATARISKKTFSNPQTTDSASPAQFFVMPALSDTTSTDAKVSDPRIKAIIEYEVGEKTVKYFNNGLPWYEAGVANVGLSVLGGSVNVQGAKQIRGDLDLKAVSNLGTDTLRNTIFQNVSALRPANLTNQATGQTITIDDNSNFNNSITNAHKIMGGEGIYAKGNDLKITGSTPIPTWWADGINNGPIHRTIIVEDGNVFIDKNLDTKGNQKLAIVVLRDRNATNVKSKGNVYISSEVTDLVNVHIYADGAVFSYNGTVNSTTGEPNLDGECSDKLKNQLYIRGTISSQNTIGGADRTPPIIGGGQALGTTIADINRAKQYDWNYVRCFTKEVKVDKDGIPVLDADNQIQFETSGTESVNAKSLDKPDPVIVEYLPIDPRELSVFGATREGAYSIR